MEHPKCDSLRIRAEKVLGGGPATLSKHWNRYPAIGPKFLVRGDGPYVWCADNERYVDCVAGLGPIILGANNPAVSLAVMEQADAIACGTLSTPLECEVAEMLCDSIPGAEQGRFACNGKDVTEAAVKLARYVTGHRHVVYCGYHGGFADYLITTNKDRGILPSLSNYNHQVPWRNFDVLDDVLESRHSETIPPAMNDLAAIILEVPPEGQDITREDTAETIQQYKDIAHKNKAIFILDEIVTGLRYAIGGAQEYYGVTADLVTMSKALGNGYPIAAILGRRSLMQGFEGGNVFLSTTFGASPIGLAAAKATLTELQSKTHGRQGIEEWGSLLQKQMQEAFTFFKTPCTLRGNFARLVIDWHDVPEIATAAQLHTLWMQETSKRGVLFGVPIFPMTCWDSDIIKHINETIYEALDIVSVENPGEIDERLEGPAVTNVFQRYGPEQRD